MHSQSRSVHLQAPRPENHRQRSNSLPIGLASMNAEEAGILFSAAEKATARRRRILSVDSPAWAESRKPAPSYLTPLPSAGTIRPSPLANFMEASEEHRRTLHTLEMNQERPSTPSLLQSSPISPRRQVASHSLKNYADGLFTFTQSRLNSAVPLMKTSSMVPDIQIGDGPLSAHLDRFPRPGLNSHFSDWSTVTGTDQSHRVSLNTPPDINLMSPDSFFGPSQPTPTLAHSGNTTQTCASSPTYPPSVQPVTPQNRLSRMEEDISYFSNFAMYQHTTTRSSIVQSQTIDSPAQVPETMVINLSPIEAVNSPQPVQPLRRREGTVRRDHAILSRTCGSTPGSGNRSTPSTPFERGIQLAEVAVRIPHWLVGAIG